MTTPSMRSIARRRLGCIAAASAILLVAACGGDDASSTTTPATVAGSAVTTTAPAASTEAGPATTSTEAAASSTSATEAAATTVADGPRTVVHAAGTTEIPAGVERVVVLDQAAALDALALGVEPAVAFAGFGSQPPLDEIIATYPDVEVEPYAVLAPSVEAVAAAAPDLILASGHPSTIATYDAYRSIAPTVVIPYDADWRDQLDVAAAALGREARGAEVAAVIEHAVAALRDAVAADGLAGTTVSVLAARGGTPYAFPTSGLAGQLLADIGVDRPAAQQVPATGPVPFIPFSVEALADHDADVLILLDSAATDTDEVIVAAPLYPTLGAVTAGRAYAVDGDMWLGASPFSALWMAQDLTSILVDHRAPDHLGGAVERWQAFAG